MRIDGPPRIDRDSAVPATTGTTSQASQHGANPEAIAPARRRRSPGGVDALEDCRPKLGRVWNRIPEDVRDQIVASEPALYPNTPQIFVEMVAENNEPPNSFALPTPPVAIAPAANLFHPTKNIRITARVFDQHQGGPATRAQI
ncbi:hypothetical protein Nham_1904 [Nitrobacter hamburgensis X14]|uniref:Uncharacterized protein n=1 Tax=Nitrobacter hamburgensis (strain DSM 10229 / NCIMB 13809 / X14) TaxID=323097 RepID=Q1QM35_NITHX|nr:hypothetical protein Nham_1904 [Nitrobacter hamburgensis X14]